MLKPGYPQLGEVVSDDPMNVLDIAQIKPEPTTRKHTAKIIEDPNNSLHIPGIIEGTL